MKFAWSLKNWSVILWLHSLKEVMKPERILSSVDHALVRQRDSWVCLRVLSKIVMNYPTIRTLAIKLPRMFYGSMLARALFFEQISGNFLVEPSSTLRNWTRSTFLRVGFPSSEKTSDKFWIAPLSLFSNISIAGLTCPSPPLKIMVLKI